MSAEVEPSPGHELLTKPVKLDVMLVDAWLIFDCPHCGQTIKLDRKDSVHPIECPACESAFEPLLDREVKLPPRKVPTRSRRRRGSRGSSRRPSGSEGESEGGEARDSSPKRPTAASLPSEGTIQLKLAPAQKEEASPEPEAPPSRLPVRSALEFERRRVESVETRRSQPDEKELNAVIEEQSGGKYKRIRVRTRKKRLTEKQRLHRMIIMGSALSLLVISLSLWAASQIYKPDEEGADEVSLASAEAPFTDPSPIGPEIANRNVLLSQLLEVENVGQLQKLIRRPRQLANTLVSYYGGEEVPRIQVKSFRPVSGVRTSLPKDFSRYQMTRGSESLPIYIEKTDTHGYRLDWESFVGLGEMPWDQFVESRATRRVRMRFFLSEAEYYEAPFTRERYVCVRIEDPSRDHDLYGYYSRTDGRFARLRERMFRAVSESNLPGQASGEIPVVMDIRYPAGTTRSHQVEIVEYVTDSWLIP